MDKEKRRVETMTAWECLIAKTDPQNPEKDLPLWMHLRDTAEVMRYLVYMVYGSVKNAFTKAFFIS